MVLGKLERVVRILLRVEKVFPFGIVQAFLIGMFVFCGVFVINTAILECTRSSTCGNNAFKEEIWGPPPDEDILYCEEDVPDSIIREKRNSLTALAFIHFGFVIILFGAFDAHLIAYKEAKYANSFKSNIISSPFSSFIFGLAQLYLGFGTFVFHAYGSKIAESHDRASIILHLIVVQALSFTIFTPYGSKYAKLTQKVVFVLGLIASVAALVVNHLRIVTPDGGFVIIAAQVGAALLTNIIGIFYRYRIGNKVSYQCLRYLGFTVVLFVSAFVVQEESVPVKCNSTSIFQLHALWHVLSSLGFFALYMYFRADGVDPLEADSEADDKEEERDLA